MTSASTEETTRPVTLFTGQWADLTLEEIAEYASEWGYDGLEIACSGEHLDVGRAAEDDAYLQGRLEILDKHGLKVWAISNHLKGQAVCDDPIDFRHQAIVGTKVWGDGDAEGVRQRAAEELKLTAQVARKLGVDTVVGFTGSKIWPYVAQFPPVPAAVMDEGYQDFADRWNPILDVFDDEGVRFAHEVHPSEIAYDYWSTVRSLEVIGHRAAFGLNWDPSHMMWQDIDPVGFIVDFADRIYHVDCKDTRLRPKTGRAGVLGSHLPWRRAVGGLVPRAQLHRLQRPDLDRVGGRRHGSPARREGGDRLRSLTAVEAAHHILRRRVQQPGLSTLSRLSGFGGLSRFSGLSRFMIVRPIRPETGRMPLMVME
jgi:sugar phosphate isomerase/epimerase